MSLANHPETRRRVSEALIDTLADLHAVDIAAPPVAALGKPSGFVARQVEGWTDFALAEWCLATFGLPAALASDADAAGLAEALFGAGAGHPSLTALQT